MEQLHGFGDAIEHVMKEIREKVQHASRQTGVIDSLKSFAAAVDWSERWILALLAIQALIFTTAIIFRRNLYISGVILALAASVIYGGEHLNQILARNWKSFANQPYFDKNGIFFGAVISTPLLFTMFALLVSYLISSSSLLINLKRKELIHKARQRAAQDGSQAAAKGQKKDR